ncbi:hypothetical protein B0H19DRAFT_1079231 [Mycena capillaripes]|nr:hypothetical protein B0H19DRAFT_1079231 [Mycena capillaripes]
MSLGTIVYDALRSIRYSAFSIRIGPPRSHLLLPPQFQAPRHHTPTLRAFSIMIGRRTHGGRFVTVAAGAGAVGGAAYRTKAGGSAVTSVCGWTRSDCAMQAMWAECNARRWCWVRRWAATGGVGRAEDSVGVAEAASTGRSASVECYAAASDAGWGEGVRWRGVKRARSTSGAAWSRDIKEREGSWKKHTKIALSLPRQPGAIHASASVAPVLRSQLLIDVWINSVQVQLSVVGTGAIETNFKKFKMPKNATKAESVEYDLRSEPKRQKRCHNESSQLLKKQ